jgi:PRD1 phage membrane DNA delivery
MGDISGAVVAVTGALIMLAIIAVVVSKNAQTGTILTSGGSALSSVITAAVAPVANAGGNTFGSASPVQGVTL